MRSVSAHDDAPPDLVRWQNPALDEGIQVRFGAAPFSGKLTNG